MSSILAHISNTPLVRLERIGRDLPVPVLVKCEHMNPGGSVKDRIATECHCRGAQIAESAWCTPRRVWNVPAVVLPSAGGKRVELVGGVDGDAQRVISRDLSDWGANCTLQSTPGSLQCFHGRRLQERGEQFRRAFVWGSRTPFCEQSLALGDHVCSNREIAALVAMNVHRKVLQDVSHTCLLAVCEPRGPPHTCWRRSF